MPTSATAKPPKACDSAMRSGILVMGILSAITVPMAEPRTMPTRIHW